MQTVADKIGKVGENILTFSYVIILWKIYVWEKNCKILEWWDINIESCKLSTLNDKEIQPHKKHNYCFEN